MEDFINIEKDGNNIKIKKDGYFDLFKTLGCGQFFRYFKEENSYIVQKTNDIIRCSEDESYIYFYNIDINLFIKKWFSFFDLDNNYKYINTYTLNKYPELKEIIENARGIRILNQDKIETIISFIISQNKKIPQIKKCINLLCEKYGDVIFFENKKYYSFPKREVLATLSIEDFRNIKMGFRDRYLFNVLQKIESNVVDLDTGDNLKSIVGIGNKVYSCIDLFAYHNFNSFPIDTWIFKTIKKIYMEESSTLKEVENFCSMHFDIYGGYVQQCMFYNAKEKTLL